MSWRASLLAVALAAAVVPTVSYAQNQPGGGGNGGGRQRDNNNGGGNNGGRQRGGQMDMAGFNQRRLDRIKQQLGAQDDEWKVLEPKVSKIMDAQTQAAVRGMGFGGGRGPGGGGGDQQQPPTTKIGTAMAELRKATENESVTPEEIDKKLASYRDARKEAQTSLETSRKELKELLTPKQEAVLVLNGILE